MKNAFAIASLILSFFTIPNYAAEETNADQGDKKQDSRGAPTTTVEELANDIRDQGFQWDFLGRRISFTATTLTGGETPRLQIDGMEKDKFDTTVIHNPRPDLHLKVGEKVRVNGMIVDQWYGVWQIWCYEMSRVTD